MGGFEAAPIAVEQPEKESPESEPQGKPEEVYVRAIAATTKPPL